MLTADTHTRSEAAATEEDSVPITWVFFNQSNPDDCFLDLIRLPRSLFGDPCQKIQGVFEREIKELLQMEVRERSTKFWKPKLPLLLDTARKDGWTKDIQNFQDHFERIPGPRPLALELGSEIGNKDIIHLVVTAERVAPVTFKRPLEDVPGMRHRVRTEKRARISLPPLQDLVTVLNQSLAPHDKIPIGPNAYADLLSGSFHDFCSDEELSLLFRKVDYEGVRADDISLYTVVLRSPPAEGTENFFHHFWDDNVRCVLEYYAPIGKAFRNSSKHPETRLLRPDFGYLFHNMCCFRGEEQPPHSRGDPMQELADKLVWVYDPAPYVLGYHCIGADITIVAISRPLTPDGKPVIHNLVTADLRLRSDRIKNIRRLINLSALFQPMASLVSADEAEFVPLERDKSTIEIAGPCIIKTYTCPGAREIVYHLDGVYTLLKEHSIPNTDVMVYHKGNTVHLSPRGIHDRPRTEEELCQCLECILETLKALHKIPAFHRDIRWENVVRERTNEKKWFLIDWEDAACPPTTAQPRFNRETLSPRILVDGHGAEVDIWGVGYLIVTSTGINKSPQLESLGHQICAQSCEMTAKEVLRLLKECE